MSDHARVPPYFNALVLPTQILKTEMDEKPDLDTTRILISIVHLQIAPFETVLNFG